MSFTRDDVPPVLRPHIPAHARLSSPQQGMTSEVIFVEGDAPCVIKRCRDSRYVEWLSREHVVLRALADSSLPVPRVFGYAQVATPNGGREAWLVMSRLAGRSLWTALVGADSRERARLLRGLGDLLRQLHAAPVPRHLCAESPWLDRMLARAEQNLPWSDGTAELLADLHRRRPATVPETLIHGDLALDNVLVTTDNELSLIDWSGGAQGDPRYDVVLGLDTKPDIELSEIERAAFFEGYGPLRIDPDTQQWFENLYEFF